MMNFDDQVNAHTDHGDICTHDNMCGQDFCEDCEDIRDQMHLLLSAREAIDFALEDLRGIPEGFDAAFLLKQASFLLKAYEDE
mgnify:CR=1 FL=1